MLRKLPILFAICFVDGLVYSEDSRVSGEEMGHWTHSRMIDGKRPEEFRWKDILGQRVVVEGIAWGNFDPWGQYVILDGARVYVDSKPTKIHVPSPIVPNTLIEADGGRVEFGKAAGLPVRVAGILATERIQAGTGNQPGPAQEVVLYRIKNATWERIDRIEWPWLQLLKNVP